MEHNAYQDTQEYIYSPEEFVTLVDVELFAFGRDVVPGKPRAGVLFTEPVTLGTERPGAPELLLVIGPLRLDDEVAVVSYCKMLELL